MSHKSFARFRAISIAIFVVGVVSAGFAYSLHKRNGPQLRPRKGFTLRMKETTIPVTPRQPGPLEILSANTTRYQRSDGTFKQVRVYYDAKGAVVKKDILFGIPGQGVFSIKSPKGPLEFLSSMPPKEKTSYVPIDDGHNQPRFLRDDWVQGYQTYVLHFPDDDGSGYSDLYCAPELDGTPIRRVYVSIGGVGIEEAVEIKLGDPDDRVFGPLPNFMINYDLFRSKISTMEEAGKHDVAQAMQKELDDQIAKEWRQP